MPDDGPATELTITLNDRELRIEERNILVTEGPEVVTEIDADTRAELEAAITDAIDGVLDVDGWTLRADYEDLAISESEPEA